MMKVFVWCHLKYVTRLHTAHIVFTVTLLYNYCDHYCDLYFPLTCFITLSIQNVRWLSITTFSGYLSSPRLFMKKVHTVSQPQSLNKVSVPLHLTAIVHLTPRLWQLCGHWGSFPFDIEYLEWMCIVWDRTHQTNSVISLTKYILQPTTCQEPAPDPMIANELDIFPATVDFTF